MKYEAVIGLEVHAQLLTNSKVFCGCSTKFGAEANTQVCPVCLGMPGTLPVLNKTAVEYAIKMALATHCRINNKSIFARKNYFYPDLPKGYQISQYNEPLTQKGYIDIEVNGAEKRIGITRIHMEEDAGKLLHGESYEDADFSFVDLNRAGVPLIEIVSEPDIRNSEEAVEYLKSLRDILVYLEICDGNMEEGSFRCDANVSIRPVGQKEFGTKAELKNMNSFRFVQKAIEYEINRQIEVIEDGGKVIQETRLFDSDKGVTVSMRSKEEAHDYRYFPEPDLLPLQVDEAWIEKIKASLPELPAEKRERFVKDYGIPSYDAGVLCASKELANYYEECIEKYEGQGARGKGQETAAAKNVSNWIMGELLRLLKEDNKEAKGCPVQPETLVKLIKMVDAGTINQKTAKEVFEEVYKTGKEPEAVVKEKGLVQISDEGALFKVLDAVIAANPKEAAEYKAGKEKLFTFFVGQTMKATKGQANPQVLNKLVKERLAK
ncbi:MAG: Asp-tRNA(Asn)/Glu-tRNA(Gln) amidotransferase subunit GatB [Deltaproteobacteria bacterium]|nr:Asp-tRNA(Asn)/Glu-tRNA(Gln) amidotransferase subunit GatB [Deltaproteobacteria bacterium]